MLFLPDLSLWELGTNLHSVSSGGGAHVCQRKLVVSFSQVGAGDEARVIGVASRWTDGHLLYLLSNTLLASVYGNFVGPLVFFLFLCLSHSLCVYKSEDNFSLCLSLILCVRVRVNQRTTCRSKSFPSTT